MVIQTKQLSQTMLLFCEKRLFWANMTIFALISFFYEMYGFAKLKLKYTLFQENHTLFQENHTFPLQNHDL